MEVEECGKHVTRRGDGLQSKENTSQTVGESLRLSGNKKEGREGLGEECWEWEQRDGDRRRSGKRRGAGNM